MIAYEAGLVTTGLVMLISKHAQPALLYLVSLFSLCTLPIFHTIPMFHALTIHWMFVSWGLTSSLLESNKVSFHLYFICSGTIHSFHSDFIKQLWLNVALIGCFLFVQVPFCLAGLFGPAWYQGQLSQVLAYTEETPEKEEAKEKVDATEKSDVKEKTDLKEKKEL